MCGTPTFFQPFRTIESVRKTPLLFISQANYTYNPPKGSIIPCVDLNLKDIIVQKLSFDLQG